METTTFTEFAIIIKYKIASTIKRNLVCTLEKSSIIDKKPTESVLEVLMTRPMLSERHYTHL